MLRRVVFRLQEKAHSLTSPRTVLLAFVVAGTLGVGFAEIGGGVWGAVQNMLRTLGIMSK